MEYVTLSNGVKMPILGYGVYQVTKDECERCVLDALKVGYRAIDTAQSYFNEEEVGNAIEKSGVPREEIFLTTKVWIEHYGYEEAKKSVLESMKKLKTDYLDLVLLHQPFSDAYGAYRALEDLYDEGKIRAIGISNFYVDRMVDFASFNRIKPMINQVETHIFNQQKKLKEWADKYGIQLEAWAPFGEGRGGTFDNPKKAPVVDLKKIQREFHRETADIKALARTGRKDDARIALHKLETRLHRDDIKEFDAALTDIRKQYGLENAGAVKKEENPTKKNKSEAEMLLQKGLFAEAKRIFAEEGNSEMAQACSKLIRAKRNIASYVNGIDSVRRSRNMTSKQNAIRELENCSALYRLYNLETAEIEQLIEQYKTI